MIPDDLWNCLYCAVLSLFVNFIFVLFQASLESEITRCGGVLNGFISSTEEILTRFITQYFPTQIIKSVGFFLTVLLFKYVTSYLQLKL